MALFGRERTDDELVERIRRNLVQFRKVGRVFTVLFGAGLVATLFFVWWLWHAFQHTFKSPAHFTRDYTIGIALGFVVGAMLLTMLFQFVHSLSMWLGSGFLRIHRLLVKYYDMHKQPKT